MTASTRTTVLSLYMRVFRIARTWQAQSGVPRDTETERRYILQEARTLFRQNQQLTEQESIKRCIEECEARIEIGENGEKLQVFFTCSYAELKPLQPKSVQNDVTYTNTSDSVSAESLSVCQSLHYRNPYPRATYLPPLGLATQKGRKLRAQQRLRKQAKPIYLQSHDET